MIRKLMASCAVAALMSAGAFTLAEAQTDPATPAVTQDTAAAPDTTTAAPTTELAASTQTLTPDKPTLATSFIGKSVYSSADPESDNIGDVNDLIVSEKGEITHAVIGVGGFLGIGEKNVAVPFDELKVVERDGDLRLVYSATKEQLQAAPAFDRTAFDPAKRASANTASTETTTAPATTDETNTAANDTTGTVLAPAPAPANDQSAANDQTAAPAPAEDQTAANTQQDMTAVTADQNAADNAATQTASANAMTANDFVQTAAVANMFEIKSSELARDHAESDQVKTFAQKMIDDHTKAGDDMKAAVESANADITVPTDLDQPHKDMLDKLQAANGADFDRQYVDMQVKAHDDAVKLFQDFAEKGDNDQVKQFAQNTLPTLKDHQKMIHDMSDQMSSGGTAMATDNNGQQVAQTNAPAADNAQPAATDNNGQQVAQTNAQPAANDNAATTAQPVDQGFVSASADQIRATTLIGSSVYGSDNKSIGEISDIVLDKESGARVVLIDVGGFLGIGEKTVAIPFKDLKFTVAANPPPATTNTTTDNTAATSPTVDNTTANNTAAPADNTNMAAAPEITVGMTKDQLEQLPKVDKGAVEKNPSTAMTTEQPAENATTANNTTAADTTTTADNTNANADQITTGSVAPTQDVAANKLIGARVYGTDNADVGEIGDVVFDKEGKIHAVIVDVGGFLGIGEKPVALNFDTLDLRTDENGNMTVAVNATKDQLKNAPKYEVTAQ